MSKQIRVFVRQDELALLMARSHISQNGLARALKLSTGYVSQLTRGTRCPSPKLRQRLQQFLKVDDFDALFRIES
jgi:transcriptional regulator with XRE-family HTH domain